MKAVKRFLFMTFLTIAIAAIVIPLLGQIPDADARIRKGLFLTFFVGIPIAVAANIILAFVYLLRAKSPRLMRGTLHLSATCNVTRTHSPGRAVNDSPRS